MMIFSVPTACRLVAALERIAVAAAAAEPELIVGHGRFD